MVLHNCDVCSKGFRLKTDLERHKNRKNKCQPKTIDVLQSMITYHQNTTKPVESIINLPTTPPTTPPISTNNSTIQKIDDIHNKCIKCDKQFSRSDSYNRHVLFRCKNYDKPAVKNKDVIELLSEIKEQQTQMKDEHKQEIIELKNTIKELKQQNASIIAASSTTTNNNSNNTTNNTINNTINVSNNIVLKFGSKIDHRLIPTEKLVHFLNQGVNKTIPLMVEEIHCNINHPEYHNVYIADKRSKEAVIYDGMQYKTVYLDETIEELDSNMKTHITDRFYMVEGLKIDQERFNRNYTEDERTNIVKRLRKLNDVEEDSSDYKRSNRLIKYILCDYKETIKDTRKRLEKKQKRRLASTETLGIE